MNSATRAVDDSQQQSSRSAAPTRSASSFKSPQFSLFIGNIAWDVSQDLLQNMLDDVLGPGQYSQVRVAVDRESGRPRGFAHVDFRDEAKMQRALSELDGIELMGRQLRVDPAERPVTGTPFRR